MKDFESGLHADDFNSGLWIRNIKIHHPVGWVFSIGGSDVEMKNIYIDAKSSDGYPFNTGKFPSPIISEEDSGATGHECCDNVVGAIPVRTQAGDDPAVEPGQ